MAHNIEDPPKDNRANGSNFTKVPCDVVTPGWKNPAYTLVPGYGGFAKT